MVKKQSTKRSRVIIKQEAQTNISATSIIGAIIFFAISAWSNSGGYVNAAQLFMVFGIIWAATAVVPVMTNDRFYLTLVTVGLLLVGWMITQPIMTAAIDELFEMVMTYMIGSIDYSAIPYP